MRIISHSPIAMCFLDILTIKHFPISQQRFIVSFANLIKIFKYATLKSMIFFKSFINTFHA